MRGLHKMIALPLPFIYDDTPARATAALPTLTVANTLPGYGDVFVAPVPNYDKRTGQWDSLMPRDPDRPYWLGPGVDYPVTVYVACADDDEDADELRWLDALGQE